MTTEAEYEAAIDRLEEARVKIERIWFVYTHGMAFAAGMALVLGFLLLVAILS